MANPAIIVGRLLLAPFLSPAVTTAHSSFLSHLASLFPSTSSIPNPYGYVAGIVFAANNAPREVATVYSHAVARAAQAGGGQEAEKTTSRRFREALFKTAVLYGAPRMINALLEVTNVSTVPLDGPYRDPALPPNVLRERGERLFNETYGSSAQQTRTLLRGVHPDFDYFMTTLIYGPVYAASEVLPDLETSLAMIAALIAIEAPLQTKWHIAGALRHGATQDEVDAVVRIAELALERVQASRGARKRWLGLW